ncbi:MAG: hypothetical protein RL720_545, partial [Actinomycetota bacterium]
LIPFGRDVPQENVIDNSRDDGVGEDRDANNGEQSRVFRRGPRKISAHRKGDNVDQAGLDGEVAEIALRVESIVGHFRPNLCDDSCQYPGRNTPPNNCGDFARRCAHVVDVSTTDSTAIASFHKMDP